MAVAGPGGWMAVVGLLSFLPEGQECAASWGTVRANSPKNGASVGQEKLSETLAQQHGKPECQGGVETSPEMDPSISVYRW